MAKQNIITFLQSVGAEMKKVSWPSRQQLQESTIVTIIGMLIFALFVYVIDLIFAQLFGLIF
jgi:preprotein translocase subunit SecE